jgi:hypothetical protein
MRSAACAATRFALQQGTYALDDGVYPWMASVAQDKKGDIAVGFTVSNGSVASGQRAAC